MFYKKRCSQKSCEINRKAPVSESLFQQPWIVHPFSKFLRDGIHTKVTTINVISTFLFQPTHSGKKRRTVTDTYKNLQTLAKLTLYNFGQDPWKYLQKCPFFCKLACCRSAGLLEIHSFTDIFQWFWLYLPSSPCAQALLLEYKNASVNRINLKTPFKNSSSCCLLFLRLFCLTGRKHMKI